MNSTRTFRDRVAMIADGGIRGSVRRTARGLVLAVIAWAVVMGMSSAGGNFQYSPAEPTLDRWVYPFNFEPGKRVVAPTYGSFDSRFDTRDAQFLLGWDTAGVVATNAGPARYLVRRLRITLVSMEPAGSNLPFVYDPTYDSYRTYVTDPVDSVPDADPGRPIELYGVGYRGEFTAATFLENSLFGPLGSIFSQTISIATRNAYGAMYDTNGVLLDVANNVGQRNADWTAPPFETKPWAIGTTTEVQPGQAMTDGARMSFDVDLSDPLVLGHVQRALDEGRLRFMVSSLSPAGQSTSGGTGAGGTGAYPWWATKENLIYDAPALELEGTVVSTEDTDGDGVPDDWERFYFQDLSADADGDADGDGATQRQEYLAGTDPRSAASVLRVLSWSRTTDGAIVLGFPVAASREYVVEASADLGRWTALAGRLSYPGGGLGRWQETAAATGTVEARFLRVSVR